MFKQKIHLDLPDSNITYYPNLIDPKAATHYFNILKNAAPWQQDDIKVVWHCKLMKVDLRFAVTR